MQRCKTCGREFTANQVMTYSVYGYCSWDCLMKKKSRVEGPNRQNRRNNGNNGQRSEYGQRAKWAYNH